MATERKGAEKQVISAFDEAYGRLNEAQKRAVDTVEGPVMVIAGPGTGKTQILALRIANILRLTDASPSSILALTFTESGAASMTARLVSLMGQDGYHVRVHTFHGFCNEVIRNYPDRFQAIIGRMPLIELDAIALIKSLLDEQRPQLLRPYGKPDLYVMDIKAKLSEVKREHVTPQMLAERIADERARIENVPDRYHEKGAYKGKMKGAYTDALRQLEKAQEFADIYAAYEQRLAEEERYDFEDTIVAVIETLAKDEELKLILQEEYQYILADEHQDANSGQNELLVLLSDFHPEPNLFVVGDEKQAIYRFQGASLENFFSFKRRYKNAAVVPLSENYRSTQCILDAAHALIESAHAHAEMERARLQAQGVHDGQELTLACAPDEDTEHAYIAEQIAKQVGRGTPAHEIAILVRRNADVPILAAALARRGIPYTAYGDDPVLAHPAVREFVTLLRAVAHFGDDVLLYPVLALPYTGISNLDVYRLTTAPLYRPGALYALISDVSALTTLGVRETAACVALFAMLDIAAREVRERPLVSAIERILSLSGALARLLSRPDALAANDIVRAFLRYVTALISARPALTLAGALSALDEAKEYRLTLSGAVVRRERAVLLMTVHRAKGMEFDHVFIPHMHDRMWGARSAPDRLKLPLFAPVSSGESDMREDDERRLLYVAMTRARKTLAFSYAEMANNGSRQVRSRFVEELADEHVREEGIASADGVFAPAPRAARQGEGLSDEEKTFLRERLAAQGLSVTALNNYLESPWKYFFNNLLRIPKARAPHVLYGSAIDETLKWYTDRRKEGSVPDAGAIVGIFIAGLARKPLGKKDFETYGQRGTDALSGYVARYGEEWHVPAESAIRLTVPFEMGMPELPVITLNGEFDKLEHLGGSGTVRIVDYKTGKPKTRGEIEGTTKSSNGNLKRQLVFYRLLAELDPAHRFEVHEEVLDFVEPGAKGKYHRESFVITTAETEELKNTVREVLRAVYAFAFWDAPCDETARDEEYCALARAFKMRTRIG